jgi:hypothetical protein
MSRPITGKKSQHNIRTVYRNYKVHAKQLNVMFDLSYDVWIALTQQACIYCGEPPSNRTRPCRLMRKHSIHPDFVYSGLDRVDTTKGYTLDNVVPCCKHCNRSKAKRTQADFISWIFKAHKHLSEKSAIIKCASG